MLTYWQLLMCRSKDERRDTAVLLDMGEYLHCAPGQQLPLVLGARDLQLSTAFGAASPGGLQGEASETEDTPSPQLPAEDIPDAPPMLSVAPRTKSRLQFESLTAGLAAAELSPPAPSASAAAPPPAPSDVLESYRRSPPPKQMLTRQKTSWREVGLLHLYQVGPRWGSHFLER